MVCTMSASRCWWGIRAGDGVNEMLGFQEIIIGLVNQEPICTGNKRAYVFISYYVVCCLYVMFLLPPERAPKAGPCHLSLISFMSKLI